MERRKEPVRPQGEEGNTLPDPTHGRRKRPYPSQPNPRPYGVPQEM